MSVSDKAAVRAVLEGKISDSRVVLNRDGAVASEPGAIDNLHNPKLVNGQGEGYYKGNGVVPKDTRIQTPKQKRFDFNKYLRDLVGDPPKDMIDPHAHHILFKEGHGKAQSELVIEGQELLRKYGIDPIYGPENLVWAPNRIAGQHDYAALKNVVDQLKAVEHSGGDYEDILEKLKTLGKLAASRR